MKTLFLIRGLPGSGKSTLALELDGVIYEADDYFMTSEGYKYDPSHIGDAHQQCQTNTEDAMRVGISHIIVSNTFTQRWEMKPYLQLALEYDYHVVEVTLSGPLFPNIHGVPEETIQKMRARWEQ